MDADLKQRWVAALRSGQYEQGTDYLVSEHPDAGRAQYCCLGVLCELLQPNSDWGSLRDEGAEQLSNQACENLDIPYNEMTKLTLLNDIQKRSFSQIADYIEANL